MIFAGSTPSVQAAKAATATIPIIFVSAGDPVQLGMVASFNRPGGNATGVNLFTTELEPKKLELLHEFVPKAVVIGVLVNPSYVHAETQSNDLLAAAGALGRQIHVVNASNESDIDAAFATLSQRRIGALLVTSSRSSQGCATGSSGWQHVTRCLQSTDNVSSSRPMV